MLKRKKEVCELIRQIARREGATSAFWEAVRLDLEGKKDISARDNFVGAFSTRNGKAGMEDLDVI